MYNALRYYYSIFVKYDLLQCWVKKKKKKKLYTQVKKLIKQSLSLRKKNEEKDNSSDPQMKYNNWKLWTELDTYNRAARWAPVLKISNPVVLRAFI